MAGATSTHCARRLVNLLVALLWCTPIAQLRAAKAMAAPRLVVVVDRTELGAEVFAASNGRRATLPGRATDVAVDRHGNLFMADNFVGARPPDIRCQLRERLAATGMVRVVAGALPGAVQGKTPAQRLALSVCRSVAVDATGNVYVISTRFPYGRHPLQLFRIGTGSGSVRAIAGCLRCSGSHPGRPATQSNIEYVLDLAVDRSGKVLLPDEDMGTIWSVTRRGVLQLVADDVCRFPPQSSTCPEAIAPANHGTIYFDGEQDRRVVEALKLATGEVSIVAGRGSCHVNRYYFCGNNVLATQAKLAGAGDIAVDSAGNLSIADVSVVQRVNARTHRIALMAGNGKLVVGPIRVHRGQSLPALTTTIEPQALAVGPTGAVFIAEQGSGAVLELQPAG